MKLVVYRFIEQSHDFHIWHNEPLDIMEINRTCKGNCKKFRVKKPTGQSRYGSGHVRCQICDVWMDYRGCRLKDGSPATTDSVGWFCTCCNYRIRQNPRTTIYKKKLMTKDNQSNYTSKEIDLSYFNKRRAIIIQKIARCADNEYDDFIRNMSNANLTIREIEHEFNAPIKRIIELAYVLEPPNQISMIREFERIKTVINRIPTKQDIEEHSILHASQYEEEFNSWEHMLERLGYDPWYRDENSTKSNTNETSTNSELHKSINSNDDPAERSLEDIREDIQSRFEDKYMLKLFDILDHNITQYDKTKLKNTIHHLE